MRLSREVSIPPRITVKVTRPSLCFYSLSEPRGHRSRELRTTIGHALVPRRQRQSTIGSGRRVREPIRNCISKGVR